MLCAGGRSPSDWRNDDDHGWPTNSTAYPLYCRGRSGVKSCQALLGPGGTTAYTSDAFGQPVTQGGQAYAYDALGRVVTASGSSAASFSYSGAGNVIASDGAWKYS